MAPYFRKLTLTAHVTSSVGWFGALLVVLAHAVVSFTSRDQATIRGMSYAMSLTAWFVILPLSLASLSTGLFAALGTAWGLLKHYWIVFKLLLTSIATVVLLLKLGPIDSLAAAAAIPDFSVSDLVELRASLVAHAAGGVLMLLAAAVLGIYKPQGMTPIGRPAAKPCPTGNASDAFVALMPRWVKVVCIGVISLLLLAAIVLLAGHHGPGMHL